MSDAEYRSEIHAAIRRGIEAVRNGPASRDMVRAVAAQVLAVPVPADHPTEPSGEKVERGRALANALVPGDDLGLSRGEGALHLAFASLAQDAIEDVYADCGDTDSGVLATNVGQRIAGEVYAVLFGEGRRIEPTGAGFGVIYATDQSLTKAEALEAVPVHIEPTANDPTEPEAGFDAYYVEWMDGKS